MDNKKMRIFQILKESESPLSTKAVAERLDVDWHTAKKRLDSLYDEGKVSRKNWRNNLTLWWDKEIPI